MTELEKKIQELQEIQNKLDVTKNIDEFARLSQKAQEILDWLDGGGWRRAKYQE